MLSSFCKSWEHPDSAAIVWWSAERQIGFPRLPIVANLHQKDRHQPKARRFIRKDARHLRAPLNFPVHLLDPVGRPQEAAVRLWKRKHRKALGQALVESGGKLRSRLFITGIEIDIRAVRERPLPPGFERLVKLLCRLAYLGRRNREAAMLLRDQDYV